MISTRPEAALVFGLIGGIVIVVGAIILLSMGMYSVFLVLGLAGLIFGVLVIVASIIVYEQPEHHVAWGVIALVFSICSIVGSGGFIVGMALGIVGGALGIAWRPVAYAPGAVPFMYGPAPVPMPVPMAAPSPPAAGAPPRDYRLCMGCGRWIAWASNVCPYCGTRAPVAPWVPTAWGVASAPTSAPPAVASRPAPPPAVAPHPPPPPAVAAAKPLKAPCATCEGEAEWIPTMRRWYCPAEQRYF